MSIVNGRAVDNMRIGYVMNTRIYCGQGPSAIRRAISTPTTGWNVISPSTPKQGSSALPAGDGGTPKTPFHADCAQDDTPAPNSTGKPTTPSGVTW